MRGGQTDRMTDSTTTVCRGSAPRHNKPFHVGGGGRSPPLIEIAVKI